MSIDADVAALIRPAGLLDWLDVHTPALGDGPLRASFIHGGTSNSIVAIDRGGASAVLRRPPLNPPPNSEKAMMREARVLSALGGTDVPHPRLFAMCEDAGVIGAPFYVMERVDGWAPTLTDDDCLYPPAFETPEHKRGIGFALIDALASLSRVDYRAVGLDGYGKPDGFLERQVGRWLSQYHSYPTRYPGFAARDLPGLDYVAEWLQANLPPMSPAGIVHGDCGPPNMMFHHDAPPRVAAIIDWELATIGDPLMDIALFVTNLRDDLTPDLLPKGAHFDATHYPTRGEALHHYAERSGRDLTHIDYYLVLAQFRMACILEYKVAASMVGNLPESVGRYFAPMVTGLIEEAKVIADRTSRVRPS